jgi:threonine dehydratase
VAQEVTRDDIDAAAERIGDRVRRTPVLEPGVGAFGLAYPVVLKLELLQHTGAFKVRGAFNTILSTSVPPAGVIAASGGNHGAAVAHSATALGVPAEIFVPATTPAIKLDRLAHYDVKVVQVGDLYDDAQAACDERAAETGALLIHPFDRPEVVAGQGTVARELDERMPDLDTVLVAVGGGGLIGGVASWFGDQVRVVAVEPETSRCLGAALEAGEPVEVPVSGIAADALGAKRLGAVPWESVRRWVDLAVTVADHDIVEAQHRFWVDCRLVVEPGGATALAALLVGAYEPAPGERVAVLVCGANTDPNAVAH